jgi:ribose transport system permease protein
MRHQFNERGEVLDWLRDLRGANHPMIAPMHEHRGCLHLGSIANNRIGRYKPGSADPDPIQYDCRWGKAL